MKNIAIILASGSGERSGLDIPKQFVKIAGKTVLEHTINVFENHKNIHEIIIVTNSDYIQKIENIISKNNIKKVSKVISGGVTRRESSCIGLNSIEHENAKVLIHDAVRPFLNEKIIDDCILALQNHDAVDVAISSADTIIKINDKNLIEEIPTRKYLKRGQTPQAFDLKIIKEAHRLANEDENINVTDDCGLILKYNLGEVYVVEGDDYNMKITYPIDIAIADKLFQLKTHTNNNNDFTNLKDKVVVVFGGTKGIGEAVCQLAIKNGAKAYAFSRSTGVDVADIDSVKNELNKVFKIEEKIDYVVNSAGILKVGTLDSRSIEDIRKEIEVNYIGAINVAQISKEYLEKSKGALLFYTSSSYTRGRADYAIYSSTKAAIVNLTQALAEEWLEFGIKVNVINPQRTATPMRFENFGNEPKDSLLSPEKVAISSLNILLSDLTGQVINVRNDL